MLSVKLVVVGGDAKSKEVQLKLPTIIGRGREGVSLTLPHKLVSRKHTELFENQGTLFVRDMGSLNGTYVNNHRITEPQPLKPNQLLTLGNVTFRAIYDDTSDRLDPFPVSDTQNVLDEDTTETKSDSDTDKSLPEINAPALDETIDDSCIFANEAIPTISPEKSISLSAIDGLPLAQRSSFDAKLDGVGRPEPVNSVEINLDETGSRAQADDSKLGSFLKKLPR